MNCKDRARSLAEIAFLLAAIPAFMSSSAAAQAPTPGVAVIDFDYLDTSGETNEGPAGHEAQLALFRVAVENELEGKLGVLQLPCSTDGCRPSNTDPEVLVAQARAVGAEFLVFGSVHKVSTLIQNLQVEALDLEAEKVVLRRQISFRGDSDLAYERAGRSIGRTIVEELSVAD